MASFQEMNVNDISLRMLTPILQMEKELNPEQKATPWGQIIVWFAGNAATVVTDVSLQRNLLVSLITGNT